MWATCLAALLVAGCGELQTEESSWFRKVRSGHFQQVPFSRDLTLLGYDGWSHVGRLPWSQRNAEAIQVQLWHEVYEGVLEPDLLTSHQPETGTASGSWTARQAPVRRVRSDLLLIRRTKNGLPRYTYRAVLNDIEVSAELEVPEGSRFELKLEPVEAGTLRMDKPTLLGEAVIEGYSQRKGGTTSYTMNRRLFRWYVLFSAVNADD